MGMKRDREGGMGRNGVGEGVGREGEGGMGRREMGRGRMRRKGRGE